MKLHGHDVEAEEQKETDPELLMVVMDINERLADVETSEQLKILVDDSDKTMSMFIEQLTVAFDNGELSLAKTLLHKLKYFNNIRQQLIERELEFMDT